jgi:hypothetical protein
MVLRFTIIVGSPDGWLKLPVERICMGANALNAPQAGARVNATHVGVGEASRPEIHWNFRVLSNALSAGKAQCVKVYAGFWCPYPPR